MTANDDEGMSRDELKAAVDKAPAGTGMVLVLGTTRYWIIYHHGKLHGVPGAVYAGLDDALGGRLTGARKEADDGEEDEASE